MTLKWYASLARERALIAALQQSLIIALVTAMLATFVALAAALGPRP